MYENIIKLKMNVETLKANHNEDIKMVEKSKEEEKLKKISYLNQLKEIEGYYFTTLSISSYLLNNRLFEVNNDMEITWKVK